MDGAVAGLLARWGVPADAEAVRPARGTNNQTFVVRHGDRRWVLRISENLSPGQVAAEHRLLARLGQAGLPFAVPAPLPLRTGGTVAETPDGPASLCRWIPGVRPDPDDEPTLERLGRAYGRLGQALGLMPAEVAVHDWRNGPLGILSDPSDLGKLIEELCAAGVGRAQALRLRAAAARVAAWWPGARARLPVRIVHGDLAASNSLVDERTGEVTGVLDFEIAGLDFGEQDLVASLWQLGALDGPDWPRRTAALVRGYATVTPLTAAGISAVPELVLARALGTVLWRVARWRRGQDRIDVITDRLDALDEAVTWLATCGDELRAQLTAHGTG